MLINLDIFYLLFISCIRFVVFVYRLVNKVDHIYRVVRLSVSKITKEVVDEF